MSASYPAGVTSIKGGTLSLSTSRASACIPGIETKQAIVYVPIEDYRLHINPAILGIYFYDNSQAAGSEWVNLKIPGRDLTDGTTTGSSTVLDTITTADRLLVCFSDVVAGMYIDMSASVNGTADRVMVAEYWNGSAWTALTETDGTKSGTTSLAQDGELTFTAVTDWARDSLGGPSHTYGDCALDDIDTGLDTNDALTAGEAHITMDGDPSTAIVAGDYIIIESEVYYVNSSSATDNLVIATPGALGSTATTHTTNKDVYLYRGAGKSAGTALNGHWLKIHWTGGSLDSDVEINNLWALNKDTSRGYFRAGVEYPISFDRRVTGAIEAVTTSGADTMQITWIRTVI